MSKPYRVTGARPVLDHEPGSEFRHAFTPDEERDLVSTGRIEIVEREYQVVGSTVVAGAKPGEKFRHAFTTAQERDLTEGGHIEVAGRKAAPAATTTKEKE